MALTDHLTRPGAAREDCLAELTELLPMIKEEAVKAARDADRCHDHSTAYETPDMHVARRNLEQAFDALAAAHNRYARAVDGGITDILRTAR